MAGIREVAAKVGVSPSTVSRAINGSGYVSEAKKTAIAAAIADLDYVPNELVGNLFQKRTRLIGVVLPDIYHPFYAAILQSLERELYDNGYKTMLCNTVLESNREREYIHMLQRHVVDGIIFGYHTLDVAEYERLKVPIVTLDHRINEQIPNLRADHHQGGRLAAEKMIAGGSKKIIQLLGRHAEWDTPFARHKVFMEVCAQHGVQVQEIYHQQRIYQYEGSLAVARQVVREYPDFDGVFAVDLMAAAMLNALRESGRRVPEDVQIIGYDGCIVPYITYPQLTTIVQPIEQLAAQMVHNLVRLIRGETDQLDLQHHPVKLFVGGTTR